MILNCNSCGKQFVVPDNAIGPSGRLVQCSSCGSKWKQFPITTNEKKATIIRPVVKQAISKSISQNKKIVKKKAKKKKRDISLYSPEYLAKKHGIKIGEKKIKESRNLKVSIKPSFGFYNSLLLFLVLIVFISRGLYFSQNFIVELIPDSEFYLNYFFESVRNIFEIWKSLIANY